MKFKSVYSFFKYTGLTLAIFKGWHILHGWWLLEWTRAVHSSVFQILCFVILLWTVFTNSDRKKSGKLPTFFKFHLMIKNINYWSIWNLFPSSSNFFWLSGHIHSSQELSILEFLRNYQFNSEKYGIYGSPKGTMFSSKSV